MLCRFMTWPKASGTFIRCRMAGFLRRWTPSDQNNTAEVLKLWDDDVSRAHHLQFLAWRRLREEWTFESAPLPDCSRFFIPEVTRRPAHQREFLLDAGAHHGSVTEAFLKHS